MAANRRTTNRRRKPTLRVAVRPPEPPFWRTRRGLIGSGLALAFVAWLLFSGVVGATADGVRDRLLRASAWWNRPKGGQ